jgi:hypothetical protein
VRLLAVIAICCIPSLLAVVLLANAARRCPDLTAHCPDKCDPRTDELQAWATLYERCQEETQ